MVDRDWLLISYIFSRWGCLAPIRKFATPHRQLLRLRQLAVADLAA
ncbi:hypothetical protein [Pseudanabaena cinerea]|nr:hypothetical protein [Pseudanabaena cinerea]